MTHLSYYSKIIQTQIPSDMHQTIHSKLKTIMILLWSPRWSQKRKIIMVLRFWVWECSNWWAICIPHGLDQTSIPIPLRYSSTSKSPFLPAWRPRIVMGITCICKLKEWQEEAMVLQGFRRRRIHQPEDVRLLCACKASQGHLESLHSREKLGRTRDCVIVRMIQVVSPSGLRAIPQKKLLLASSGH